MVLCTRLLIHARWEVGGSVYVNRLVISIIMTSRFIVYIYIYYLFYSFIYIIYFLLCTFIFGVFYFVIRFGIMNKFSQISVMEFNLIFLVTMSCRQRNRNFVFVFCLEMSFDRLLGILSSSDIHRLFECTHKTVQEDAKHFYI